MIIRREGPTDISAIRFVNEQAFGGSGEANAIEQLRDRDAVTLSLVAVIDNRVVGHLLFSPATIESPDQAWPAVGLAPLSVLPDFQRQGIGTALMNAGLEECRRLGHERVVVLGHAEYYPRFGFVSAYPHGITNEFGVTGDAFMILELCPGAFKGITGMAKYQAEWNDA